MKRIGIFLLMFYLFNSLVLAQQAGITLFNNENSAVIFLINKEAAKLNEVLTEAAGKLNDNFISLAANQSLSMDLPAETYHSLLFFWVDPGALQYPAYYLVVKISKGERKTFILSKSGVEYLKAGGQKEKISIEAKSLPVKAEISIDNKYSDWKVHPYLSFLNPAYAPANFTLQSGQSKQLLPIQESLFWARGGTKIDALKGLIVNNKIYFYFSSQSPFCKGLSLYFYLRKKNTNEPINNWTIEFPFLSETGQGRVVLWQRGVSTYLTVGEFRFSGFFMEAVIDLAKIPAELSKEILDYYTFDLTTVFYDSAQRIYEEFYITSLDFADFYKY